MAIRGGLNPVKPRPILLQSRIELRTRSSVWFFGLLLISSLRCLRCPASAEPPPTVIPSVTPTTTPTATPTPTPDQISKTQTVFGALGFLFGFFLVYSITVGTKTQDVFKSFLGVAGLGGGILETGFFQKGFGLTALWLTEPGRLWVSWYTP
jgi:hypothetical protein